MAIERLAWCEISKKVIKNNVKIIREKVGSGVAIMAVVKGNAYGHNSYT